MFELKKFQSEQFGLIRTMVDDKTQEVVFNGNDVASALGYTKAANAIRDYCKGVIDLVTPTNGGPQKMKYITEPDLYRLIMASKLPDAVKFQDWVCEVILPQIRKTGGYIPVTAQDDEKTILAKAMLILQRTLNQKDALIADQRPWPDRTSPHAQVRRAQVRLPARRPPGALARRRVRPQVRRQVQAQVRRQVARRSLLIL